MHNDAHHRYRQNSNVAHEFSHALLFHESTPALDDLGSRYWNQNIEDEAQWLAGVLLMTEDATLHVVRRAWSMEQIGERLGSAPRWPPGGSTPPAPASVSPADRTFSELTQVDRSSPAADGWRSSESRDRLGLGRPFAIPSGTAVRGASREEPNYGRQPPGTSLHGAALDHSKVLLGAEHVGVSRGWHRALRHSAGQQTSSRQCEAQGISGGNGPSRTRQA